MFLNWFIGGRSFLRALAIGPAMYWDAPSSEMGLTPAAPASAPAEPASTTPDPAAASEPAATTPDDPATTPAATTAASDRPADDDLDPLDALSPDDTDDPKHAAYTPEQRLKLRARNLEKALKKEVRTTAALKAAGVDVPTLLHAHRQLTALNAAAESNPILRAIINGEPLPDPRTQNQPAARPAATASDEPLPFDTESDGPGRWLKHFHEQTLEENRTLKARLDTLEQQLGGRVQTIEQRTAAERTDGLRREWQGAYEAAAAKLPPYLQTMLRDNMVSAFERVVAGKLTKTPQEILDHYLKGAPLDDLSKKRASAAAAQRTAELNQSLPRRAGTTTGSPASPRTRPRESVAEVGRRLQRQGHIG